MQTPTLLLLVLAIQHALYGVAWWLGALVLRVPRAAALHWAGFCAACTAAVLLFVFPPDLPGVVTLRNLLVLAACVLLRRGVARFHRRDPHDRELIWLLAGTAAATAVIGHEPQGLLGRTVVLSAAMGWVLVRLGLELAAAVTEDQGRRVAAVLALPPLALGALFPLRGLVALAGDGGGEQLAITHGTDANTAVMLGVVVLATWFQFTLLYLVIQRLVSRLRHLSSHDPLTGLLNRRAWEEALAVERLRLHRMPRFTALLVVDIDHFKHLNDQHGHSAGDAALVTVARALKATARGTDVVARLGGEEFGMLLPDTDVAGAGLAAERVREAVAQLRIMVGETPAPVTVSVGAAVLPPRNTTGLTLDSLLRRADAALYRAKAEGRNRVVIDLPPGSPRMRVA